MEVERSMIAITYMLKELGELEMTPINLAKIGLLNRELTSLLAERQCIAGGYSDLTVNAARAAMIDIDWDRADPVPVGYLILALTDELNAAGHSYKNISTMLKNISDHVAMV